MYTSKIRILILLFFSCNFIWTLEFFKIHISSPSTFFLFFLSSFKFQIDTTDVQDIDLSRFVPQEVNDTGITVASTDRFTSRNKTETTESDDGEKKNTPVKVYPFFVREKTQYF